MNPTCTPTVAAVEPLRTRLDDPMKTLPERIADAIAATQPQSKARNKALAAIRWRLKSGLLYAGMDAQFSAALVGPDDAAVFDARCCEKLKLAYWQAITGRTFEVELL